MSPSQLAISENNEKQKETKEERLLEAVINLSLNFNYVLKNKFKFFFLHTHDTQLGFIHLV